MVNPYAPPTVEAEQHDFRAARGDDYQLAGLGQRFVGNLLDLLFMYLSAAPAGLVVVLHPKDSADSVIWIAAALSVVTILPFGVYQLYLVAQGQSLGKRIAKTRVVRLDGSAPGVMHGVVLRNLLGMVVGVIPGFGSLFALADVVMIFRADRRTLRDHIASTRVIQS